MSIPKYDSEREPLLPTFGEPNSARSSTAQLTRNIAGTPKSAKSTISSAPIRLPKRTTKIAQKLTLFPENKEEVEKFDPKTDNQLPHAAKNIQETVLEKIDRKWLPPVTAYCTAKSYDFELLLEYLRRKNHIHRAAPRRYDEVIYTPYSVTGIDRLEEQQADIPHFYSVSENGKGPLNDQKFTLDKTDGSENIGADGLPIPLNIALKDLAKKIAPIGEIMYFEYGVCVLWGFTEEEEKIILRELEEFQEDGLAAGAILDEQFYFHYNAHCQPRIYNDIITLKNPSNYMIKLTISHAIAQSVKLTVFEDLIEESIESTRPIPRKMATDGKITMSRKEINQKIGELFIMRINVNLVSNVLDTPEIFWSEPSLEPLYVAIRGYLEISQRVELLNQRVGVISDLLGMLKDHLNSSHGEQLEWIVIVLIGFEILIGIITISIDLATYFQEI